MLGHPLNCLSTGTPGFLPFLCSRLRSGLQSSPAVSGLLHNAALPSGCPPMGSPRALAPGGRRGLGNSSGPGGQPSCLPSHSWKWVFRALELFLCCRGPGGRGAVETQNWPYFLRSPGDPREALRPARLWECGEPRVGGWPWFASCWNWGVLGARGRAREGVSSRRLAEREEEPAGLF